MAEHSAQATLQITRPAGKTLALALVFLAVTLSGTEALARLPALQDRLPAPNLGGFNAYFDAKMFLLDRFVGLHQPPDCIILGTSVTWDSIAPAILQSAFFNETGRTLQCFNLGTPGMTAKVVAQIAQYVAVHYHPRLLIYGMDPTSYYRVASDRIQDSKWLQYQFGSFTWQGWLVDRSYLYRYSLTGQAFQDPQYQKQATSIQHRIGSDGYWIKPPSNTLNTPELPPNRETEAVYYHFFTVFRAKVSSELEAIRDLATLNQSHTTVIGVEIPLHASAHYFFTDGEEERQAVMQQAALFMSEAGLTVLGTETQPPIPDAGWANRVHMNHDGALIFSTWLGQQLAQAVNNREIPEPVAPE